MWKSGTARRCVALAAGEGQARQSLACDITSLSCEQPDAEFLLKRQRGCWHIEDRCFDVVSICWVILPFVLAPAAPLRP